VLLQDTLKKFMYHTVLFCTFSHILYIFTSAVLLFYLTTVLQLYYLDMLSGGLGVVVINYIRIMADFGREVGECSWILEIFVHFLSK